MWIIGTIAFILALLLAFAGAICWAAKDTFDE